MTSTYATAGSGAYVLSGLTAGTYRVGFQDLSGTYVSEYWNNQYALWNGSSIVVGANVAVPGISVSLQPASHIAGILTNSAGAALMSISVQAFRHNGSYWETFGDTAYSGADGRYALDGLLPGSYRVRFQDYMGQYALEWYADAVTEDDAQTITVPATSTVNNINACLGPASRIRGTVTGPGSVPLPNISVSARRWNGSWWDYLSDSRYTDSDGTYELGGLSTGRYIVVFRDYNGTYAEEFFDNVYSEDDASNLVLGVSGIASNIDANLVLAGWIVGRVTTTNGTTPLPNINISASRWTGSYYQYHDSDQSDASGNYAIGGLATGIYRISFQDYSSGTYGRQWYSNVASEAQATQIVVQAAATNRNINAWLAPAVHIKGRVTRADGTTPVSGFNVQARIWTGTGYAWANSESTDASGNYDIGGLAAGNYIVQFNDWSGTYLGEWYSNAMVEADAKVLSLASGATASNINAALDIAGHIMGRITQVDGLTPIQGVQAVAFRSNSLTGWDYFQQRDSSVSGNYDIGGLPAGTYRVEFVDYGGTYASEWYSNANSLATATDIPLAAGATQMNINASLLSTNLSILTSVASLSVPENSTATFGVRVASAPATPTTVSVSRASGDADLTVPSGTSLVFNAGNWGDFQTVTVAAANDADQLNGSATLQCASPGWGSASVTANESDDDLPPLSEAVDAPGLAWTSGGGGSWFTQISTTYDGVDAAQSGPIGDGQETWISTTVTGPGSLSFWWRVDSESNWDYLGFYIGGALQEEISGTSGIWQHRTESLGAGAHTLTWTYAKDQDCCISGLDAGWLDQVVWTPQVANDVDADGLPDDWEQRYCGNSTGLAPHASGDADSFDNWDEFIADTNPTNAQSFFPRFTNLTGRGVWQVNVGPTSTGRLYDVFWTTNLSASPQAWTNLGFNRQGTGGEIQMVFTNSVPARVHRIGVRLP